MAWLFVICGALWRWWDGTGKYARTSIRNAVGLCVGASAGFSAIGLWGILIGALAVVILIVGHTKWENPGYMFLRYGVPACVVSAAVILATSASMFTWGSWGLWYPIGCGLAGVSYWVLTKLEDKLPKFPNVGVTGSTTYVEILAGGMLVGGVAFF